MAINDQFLGSVSAAFEQQGVFVAEDWRYDWVMPYMRHSPSFETVKCHVAGIDLPHPLPADYGRIVEVLIDFGGLYEVSDQEWWDTVGLNLYGLGAPKPEVKVLGITSPTQKLVRARWAGVKCLVLELPLNLTVSQALDEARIKMKEHDFASALPKRIAPKYKLEKTKLRTATLIQGLKALDMYKAGEPLWRIGNELELVAKQCFSEKRMLKAKDPDKYAEKKRLLAIAASRLVKTASLIAENAARGRFPSDKPFKEAILTPFQRTAGRPIGSGRPKRFSGGSNEARTVSSLKADFKALTGVLGHDFRAFKK
jgi:hypothetical protein